VQIALERAPRLLGGSLDLSPSAGASAIEQRTGVAGAQLPLHELRADLAAEVDRLAIEVGVVERKVVIGRVVARRAVAGRAGSAASRTASAHPGRRIRRSRSCTARASACRQRMAARTLS
jgi:hypothetical protein